MALRLVLKIALFAGAFAFSVAVSADAAADIVDPKSPEQPVAGALVPASADGTEEATPKAAPTAEPPPATEAPPPAESAAEPEEASVPAEAGPVPTAAPAPAAQAARPESTPAPEQVVVRSSMPVMEAPEEDSGGMPILHGLERIVNLGGTYLGQVATACQVAMASGSGVPALVLAVLSMGVALDRRWMRRTHLARDEDTPEFLYAWDVIAPG